MCCSELPVDRFRGFLARRLSGELLRRRRQGGRLLARRPLQQGRQHARQRALRFGESRGLELFTEPKALLSNCQIVRNLCPGDRNYEKTLLFLVLLRSRVLKPA